MGLLVLFLVIESRVEAPLVPLRLFRLRNLATANVIGVLSAAAMFAWFFLSALYLQLVLGYSPLEVGLAFLPANLLVGGFSIGISAKLVMRFGIRPPLIAGMLFWTVGFLLFARVPVNGDYVTDVLPAMLVLGVGAGIGFNPVLLAAMNDVEPSEAGLASGVVNTSFMMGGALGLAVLASAAASRTSTLVSQGESQAAALTGGYHVAFLIGAAFTLIAAGLAVLVLRPIAMGAPAEVHDEGSHSRQPARRRGLGPRLGHPPHGLDLDQHAVEQEPAGHDRGARRIGRCEQVSAHALEGVVERGVGQEHGHLHDRIERRAAGLQGEVDVREGLADLGLGVIADDGAVVAEAALAGGEDELALGQHRLRVLVLGGPGEGVWRARLVTRGSYRGQSGRWAMRIMPSRTWWAGPGARSAAIRASTQSGSNWVPAQRSISVTAEGRAIASR